MFKKQLHRLFKKIKHSLPTRARLRRHRRLRRFRAIFDNIALWSWQRRSVALAVALGLLVAFIPIPVQMIFAALLAIACRVNLPATVMMTWINNPFTFVPLNYAIYRLGAGLLGQQAGTLVMPEWQWQAFQEWFIVVGKAYLTGLVTVSLTAALIGYFLVEIIWRIVVALKKGKHFYDKS